MKLGLVGYGFGGRNFHAPFIQAAGGIEIAAVVARTGRSVESVHSDLPGVPVHASLSDMIAAGGLDAVTITTPPATHVALVMEAIEAGLHVVADKPFAFRATDARRMATAAQDKGVVLAVFQNRRWDADLRTLRKLMEDGALGRIHRVHNRMDFASTDGLLPGPEGGLLADVGSHIIDQMLWLLGPAISVNAQIEEGDIPGGRSDVSFCVNIHHESGAQSYVSATKANHLNSREIRAYGNEGSFVVHGADAQVHAILAGDHPKHNRENWGAEPEGAWGTLYSTQGDRRIPSQLTNYKYYYEEFARAVRDGMSPPVSAEEGIHTVTVLEAARASAASGRTEFVSTIPEDGATPQRNASAPHSSPSATQLKAS
jgi:predicted dehydrogenase